MKAPLLSSPWLRFSLAFCSYLLRGRFIFPGGHQPRTGHIVSPAFPGVGVATGDDPAIDRYILDCLRKAGIRHVRLDLTYGDQTGPAARLLETLVDDGVHVVLHLVQPAGSAARMENDPVCQDEWRAFVEHVLNCYGAAVEMVEIGSTINRKSWAGYSLSGFLCMWEIAWRAVRERNLVLAGPSITDFEPPWNLGVLAHLRSRGQLPDVHTDNLFAERCAEPERYDHKIFGHLLAPLGRFNIVRKARLLQRIGADFDVPRLFSPSAFWTLPRIERRLPASEEKQADYLSRYLLLCAASGALERAWWGPLICHREGLVDDGVSRYPDLERITHYAAVTGTIDEFRVRPAMHALAGFARMIPGAHYEGRRNASSGLEIHAFRNETTLVHAVWTGDGQVAALSDIYAPEDLASARFFSRDGDEPLETPSVASESPLYLVWPRERTVRIDPACGTLKGVAVDRHAPGKTLFHFRQDGWQGVVQARDREEFLRLLEVIHPQRLLVAPAPERILRKARNLIWTLDDPRAEGGRLVAKRPLRMHFHKRLLDRLKPSKAVRSWTGTAELLRRGIGAAPPVAYFERTDAAKLMENVYVCEFSPAVCSVRDLFSRYARGETVHRGIEAHLVYEQLAGYLLKMHRQGIIFRDLSGGNILVKISEENGVQFELIDTGRLRVHAQTLSFQKRVSDLVRVCNKLHWEGRNKFLEMYFGKCGRKIHIWHKMRFVIYDLKVILKRTIKQTVR